MPIAFRHRDTIVPTLTALAGLTVRLEFDPVRMAELQGRTVAEIEARFAVGHRAYVAFLDDVPAAWGWVATSSATIGELQASFAVARGERYLWNFVTLKPFRGKGIYPRLLEAIVAAESVAAERFWIAYAPENHASGAGIERAGFTSVAELSFDRAGRPAVKEILPGGGGTAAALLGLPEIADAVSECWKCARGPAPSESSCREGECGCDYQRAEVPCAA